MSLTDTIYRESEMFDSLQDNMRNAFFLGIDTERAKQSRVADLERAEVMLKLMLESIAQVKTATEHEQEAA